MSVAGWAWNSDLGQSHISVDWTVGAVGGICGSFWSCWICGSFGVVRFVGVVALLISFFSHQRCVSSQGYTWSALHKWQNTVVRTVYTVFCMFVVHKDHKCMYTRHLEMEAYDLRSLSSEWIWEIEQWQLVNFEKQNCNSSFVNLSFKTMFWETGFVNLRCNNLARGVVLIIGKVGICLKISQTKTDSCVV